MHVVSSDKQRRLSPGVTSSLKQRNQMIVLCHQEFKMIEAERGKVTQDWVRMGKGTTRRALTK